MSAGRLEAIWIKRFRKGPMVPATRAVLQKGRGIDGNVDLGGRRQVTLIEREVWQRVNEELGATLDPSARRANLLVSGLPLLGSRGKTLRVGGLRLLINGETRPCEQMDEARAGLKDALSPPWRGGAFAEVLDDGEIQVGATVEWADA